MIGIAYFDFACSMTFIRSILSISVFSNSFAFGPCTVVCGVNWSDIRLGELDVMLVDSDLANASIPNMISFL